MQILGLLGMYFDAIVVEVKTFFTFMQIGYIYEVCGSKSEKSAPIYFFKGTPLRYSAFAWIVGLANLAQ